MGFTGRSITCTVISFFVGKKRTEALRVTHVILTQLIDIQLPFHWIGGLDSARGIFVAIAIERAKAA